MRRAPTKNNTSLQKKPRRLIIFKEDRVISQPLAGLKHHFRDDDKHGPICRVRDDALMMRFLCSLSNEIFGLFDDRNFCL